METLAQIYERHSGPGKFNDRGSAHSYLEVYETLLAPYRTMAKRILEIGLFDGHGLRMWEDFFSGDVSGIDCSDRPHGGLADLRPMMAERVWKKSGERTYLCAAHDIRILDATDKAAVDFSFEGAKFDVIFEDAGHGIDQQMQLADVWLPRLAPGGLYIVEDIQDLDSTRGLFEARGFRILDRRGIKKRYDDVLGIFGGK